MKIRFCRKGIVAIVIAFVFYSLAFAQSVEAKSSVPDVPSNAAPKLISAAKRKDEKINIVSSRGVVSEEFEIYAPNASFIKLHFNKFHLPHGLVIEVSNPDGTEVYRYSSNQKDGLTFDPSQGDDGITSFSAMSISGDTAVVRVVGKQRGRVRALAQQVEVDYFMEGLPEYLIDESRSSTEYSSSVQSTGDGDISRPESRCGLDDREDVVCLEGSFPMEVDRARPVVRLLIDGRSLCTAWRIGSSNHLITNRHCLSDQADTSNTEVWFNYQTATCGSSATSSGLVKVTGNTLLKSNSTLDFALFSVNQFEAITGFGHLGIETREGVMGEEIYIPQHGSGNPKEIGIESDMNVGGYCQIDGVNLNGYGLGTDVGYFCDTAGGSSGSPVLAVNSHRVIALHHLGGCLNSGVRMSLIWPQISNFFNGVVPSGDNVDPQVNQPPQAQFSISCSDLHCDFDASSSTDFDGNIVSYDWNLGDGGSANGMNVSHDYTSNGSFQVVLTVEDNDGAVGQSSSYVSVEASNASPVAVFQVQCVQGMCSFDANGSYDSDGSISTYLWDFGDGTSSETELALSSHEFSVSGDYLARLTVSDNLSATGYADSWITVVIDEVDNTQPNAEFTFDCDYLSCTFNATDSSDPDGFISSFSWDFGDGSVGDGELTTHDFAADGFYEVTLSVADNNEASDFITKQVQVTTPVANTLELTVTGQKLKGNKSAILNWSGAVSNQVDVLRNGDLLATTNNDGEYTDSSVPKRDKTAIYQVCQIDRLVCSVEVSVKF